MNKTMLRTLFAATIIIFAGSKVILRADPCDKDRITTCGDAKSGDGRVFDCLMGRQTNVAPACSQALDRANQLYEAVTKACQPDVQRWCAQYTGNGHAAIVNCLKDNKKKLSQDCISAYRQFKAFDFDIRS